eukprot:9095577-Pyramimonas_sp.AAC.1
MPGAIRESVDPFHILPNVRVKVADRVDVVRLHRVLVTVVPGEALDVLPFRIGSHRTGPHRPAYGTTAFAGCSIILPVSQRCLWISNSPVVFQAVASSS